jgi:hypothetical protein
MKDFAKAPQSTFAGIRFVLTDMDETLTYKGRLAARTYYALERLQRAGIKVIPVTAAPAGWCDQMARMWPVDGVIAENGGLYIQRDDVHGVIRHYWHGDLERAVISDRLAEIGRRVLEIAPFAKYSDDQPFRLTSIAFKKPGNVSDERGIVDAISVAGADVTVNNLWILAWLGGYDKLAMARRTLAGVYGVDIDVDCSQILYAGDSTNDAPMFGFFRHTVGVSTVRHYLAEIPTPPRWITAGPGGDGFVEIANSVLSTR